MLDPRQLAGLQALANRVLDQTCTIQHLTTTADAYGAMSEALSTPAVTVACLVAKPTAAQMKIYADLVGDLESYIITVPDGTDIRVNDQLVVLGHTLKVQAVMTPQSYSVLDSVLASEVR